MLPLQRQPGGARSPGPSFLCHPPSWWGCGKESARRALWLREDAQASDSPELPSGPRRWARRPGGSCTPGPRAAPTRGRATLPLALNWPRPPFSNRTRSQPDVPRSPWRCGEGGELYLSCKSRFPWRQAAGGEGGARRRLRRREGGGRPAPRAQHRRGTERAQHRGARAPRTLPARGKGQEARQVPGLRCLDVGGDDGWPPVCLSYLEPSFSIPSHP